MTDVLTIFGPLDRPDAYVALRVSAQGEVTRVRGDDPEVLVKRLLRETETSGAAAGLAGMPPANLESVPPSEHQRAALLRECLAAASAADTTDVVRDDTFIGLFVALSLLAKRGAGLPAGQSLPFEMAVTGVIDHTVCAILSAGETEITGILFPDADHMRRFYDHVLGGASDIGAVDFGSFVLDLGDSWVSRLMNALFGVAFSPVFTLQTDGTPVEMNDLWAEFFTVLALSWPDDPVHASPEPVSFAIPTGEGTSTLVPVKP